MLYYSNNQCIKMYHQKASHVYGTSREEKLFEASKRQRLAIESGKDERQAMIDAGLILDTPINEQDFLEKNEHSTKRLLTD